MSYFPDNASDSDDSDTPHGSLLSSSISSISSSASPHWQPSNEEWKQEFSLARASTVGQGISGVVFAVDKTRVMKVFANDEEGTKDLEREKTIFVKLQRGGKSDHIISFEEQWGPGLILERLTCTLRQHLTLLEPCATPPKASEWVRDICSGLEFLHDNGVLHSDIGCQNLLLDADDHVKLCDFAGSKVEDEDAWITYEPRSQHPDFFGKQPTIKTEIFALGSVLYEVWTCRPPYATEKESLVRQKFSMQDFPLSNLEHEAMRNVVRDCWFGRYEKVSELWKDL